MQHTLVLACLLVAASAAPHYIQSQNGEKNAQADIKNVVFLFLLPKKTPDIVSYLFSKKSGDQSIAQDRADVQSLDAFVEPNTPYRVIIGSEGERTVEADGGNAVVIPGQRRLEAESEPHEEMKLIGSTEQCGPERRRDPVTLMCKSINDLRVAKPENTPEVVPVLV